MPISQRAVAQRNQTLQALIRMHPGAWTELKYRNPWELLVAVILSAQCTDKLVNLVTPELFKKYKTVKDFAKTKISELDRDISRINFHQNKFEGKVPDRLEDLITLPGVGRKTANVLLAHAFNKIEGVIVDTHVTRLAQRFGWTGNSDPVKIELDLMKLFPKNLWVKLADTLVLHGRYVCTAKNPKCQNCPYEPLCPSQKNEVIAGSL